MPPHAERGARPKAGPRPRRRTRPLCPGPRALRGARTTPRTAAILVIVAAPRRGERWWVVARWPHLPVRALAPRTRANGRARDRPRAPDGGGVVGERVRGGHRHVRPGGVRAGGR